MKVLVTGGAGFIGANFIGYILREHPADEVVCLDKLTYAGNLWSLEGAFASGRFRFYQGDVCDRAGVFSLFAKERPEVCVHFAAESHVDRSISDPGVFLRTNVAGTQVMLEACRAYGARMHLISTDEVYGDTPLGSRKKFGERAALRPSSPYAASKAAADLFALAYARTYGVRLTITRSANNYGALQFPEKLIPLAIGKAIRGEPVPVYGDGKNVREWLDVTDHCRAVDAVLRAGRQGEIYNVGGKACSNLQIVHALLRLCGRRESEIVFVADRPGHDRRYALDCGKIASELGFSPKTELCEGLSRTVAWYRGHGEWLAKIGSGEYRKVPPFAEGKILVAGSLPGGEGRQA